jgi:hypothetical protein
VPHRRHSLDPVQSDRGLGLLPTTTLGDCCQLDLICIPGGGGVAGAISDPETVDFVRAQAAGARHEGAQAIRLGIKYDPAPPFTTGHPDRAPAPLIDLEAGRTAKAPEAYLAILRP